MTEHTPTATFDERVDNWVERIHFVQKSTTKRSNLSIFLGIPVGIILAILLIFLVSAFIPEGSDFLSFLLGLLAYIPIIAIPVLLYQFWAKRSKNQAIQALLDEIQQTCNSAGWPLASVVEPLVARLPSSSVCAAIAAKLDPEAAASAKEQAVAAFQEQQARLQALPKYNQLTYQEMSVRGNTIQIVCPTCQKTYDAAAHEFKTISDTAPTTGNQAGKARFKRSGQFIRMLTPGWRKWGVPIALAVIVFLCASLSGADPVMSCSLGIAIGLLGGFWILRPIIEAMVGYAFAKKVPILLFSCEGCDEVIPIASDGNVFLMGKIETAKEPAQNQESAT